MSKTLLLRLGLGRYPIALALAFGALVGCDVSCAAGFMVGAGAGLSRGKVDCLASLPCDRSDAGFKVYAGYQFTPAFDVRLGYLESGRYRGADTTLLGTEFGGAFKLGGVSLTAGYLWSFASAWSLHAQAGVASMRARFEYAEPYSGSVGKTTLQPLAGVSLGYAFSPQVRIGLDYDVTRFKVHVTRGPLQTVGLSVQYAF